MKYDPLKILRYGNKGIAVAEKVGKDKYRVSCAEHYGINSTLTLKEIKELYNRFKFCMWVEEKRKGKRHSYNSSELKN